MKTKYTLIAILLCFCFSINGQESEKKSSKNPQNIYTFNKFTNDFFGFSAINKKLNLTNFNFVYVNETDLDNNQFSIYGKNLGKNPSAFIYDDYKRYQDRNLLKGFLLKNDPTRWNLQCIPQNLKP